VTKEVDVGSPCQVDGKRQLVALSILHRIRRQDGEEIVFAVETQHCERRLDPLREDEERGSTEIDGLHAGEAVERAHCFRDVALGDVGGGGAANELRDLPWRKDVDCAPDHAVVGGGHLYLGVHGQGDIGFEGDSSLGVYRRVGAGFFWASSAASTPTSTTSTCRCWRRWRWLLDHLFFTGERKEQGQDQRTTYDPSLPR